MIDQRKDSISFLVGLGILFPLFFTLSGGIYRAKETLLDSGGVISKLPLPISILTCVIALALLYRRWPQAKVGLMMVIGTVAALLASLLLADNGTALYQRKTIMMAQVILPLIGLLVGQLTEGKKGLAIAFLTVLTVIIPLQLYLPHTQLEWTGLVDVNRPDRPADKFGLFTIYSHAEYVNVILVCAFGYAATTLFFERGLWIALLAIAVVFYTVESNSFLVIGASIGLFSAFAYWSFRKSVARIGRSKSTAASILLFVALTLSIHLSRHTEFIGTIVDTAGPKVSSLLEGKVPLNILERLGDWEFFGERILETPRTLIVGHPEPMPREVRTSPHNWYIDIAYTFGLIGLLPVVVLLGHTGRLCWNCRASLTHDTWGLAAIVFFLVVIDSNFKVTLRQPYPGIFAFFMWGMLLSRLYILSRQERS
jgi:hypothetical protein